MPQRDEIRFVRKASYAPLGPIVAPAADAPHIRDVPLSERKAELRRRGRWAGTVRQLVALADGPLPDGVLGYVIRRAVVDVPTMLLSRIALEPADYKTLHIAATSEVVIEPFPARSYVVALTGAPLSAALAIEGEGRERRSMWRDMERRKPMPGSLADAWERARIYARFERVPHTELLGYSARVRPWRDVRSPIVMVG